MSVPLLIVPIMLLIHKWDVLQSDAAADWQAGKKIAATAKYELAGELEDLIFSECCKAGIKQIPTRRRFRR